jgi:alpha-1,3-fucosyltransferase
MEKDGFAAALISHCNASSKRDDYILELQQAGIQVDVHGKCGPYEYYPIQNRRQYYEVLSKRNKFFLAFENSFCREYVTEKMFLALRYPWIPVVRGGADYARFTPETSVVDASWYSPVELATILTEIAVNETLYMSYFEWKKDYEATLDMKVSWVCKACEKLQRKPERKSYADIYE